MFRVALFGNHHESMPEEFALHKLIGTSTYMCPCKIMDQTKQL